MRSKALLGLTLGLVVAVIAGEQRVMAQETPVQGGLLGPGSRTFFGGLHLGGAINASKSVGQFKLGQEFGWHFLSGDFSGPAVGVTLQESFGDNWTFIQFAPKFWWDFLVVPSIGLYVTPFAHIGLAHSSFSVAGQSVSDTAFNWQIGAAARVILADRFYAFFQPFALDFFHGDGGTGIRYDLQLGGGVTF